MTSDARKREWKPGDVAVVRQSGCDLLALRNPEEWIDECGTSWTDAEVNKYGLPLVTIDPEDREQVKSLILALPAAVDWGFTDGGTDPHVADDIIDTFQTALREFANPTPAKPEEPTGLGAVVEDEDGDRWTRADRDKTAWFNANRFEWHTYEHINAVRVLSDGVQP